jgi:riboflavin kinase, archaea type
MAQTTKTTRPSKAMKLTGTVFTGTGEGKKYLTLSWVTRQLQNQLGYTPYPGTLNLHLSKQNAKRRKLLENPDATRIQPAQGYSTGILHKARIGTLECAIIIPENPTYPQTVLEIIAADYLREKLNLKDGTEITVTADL